MITPYTHTINSLFLIFVFYTIVSCSPTSGKFLKADDRLPPPPGMVFIPAGEFFMGSDKEDDESLAAQYGLVKALYEDEHPLHKVKLPSYYIDIYETTNVNYYKFLLDTQSRTPEHWADGIYPSGEGNRPISNVSWYQANRYCEWAAKRLPTEAEWEKAARGPDDDREFPWGNEFDKTKANTGLSNLGHLADAGSIEAGQSPYGVHEMSGNVWEWTADWYQAYEGNAYKNDKFGQKYKILKGGSWGGVGHYSLVYFYRIPYRFYAELELGYSDVGFRCVKDR